MAWQSHGIPIVVGITGHRDPRPQDLPVQRDLIRKELEKIRSVCPHSDLVLLDSVAAGGDSLCAEVGLALGYHLVCPLPLSKAEYRKDFSESELRDFEHFLTVADSVFVAPALEPDRQDRDFAYRQAGLYVATHCHVLLALYDGREPMPDGCGTAETVAFKRNGCRLDSVELNSDPCAVIQIVTPRVRNMVNPEISVRLLENTPGQLEEILKATDACNRDITACPYRQVADPLLPPDCLENDRIKRLSDLYSEADGLSGFFQKRYMRVMRAFALTGVLLVLFFLLYDTGESNLFLLSYGLLILFYFVAYLAVKRRNAHGKYLDYRLLAETARVQVYLTAAGIEKNIGSMLTWTQKHESSWIKTAIDALTAVSSDSSPVGEKILRQWWISRQLVYHQEAEKREQKKCRFSTRTTKYILLFTLVLTFVILLAEVTSVDLMETPLITESLPAFLLQHAGQTFTVRSLFKLLLGIASAGTVFLADYYGRLSLDRKTVDHRKMARLYRVAESQLNDRSIEHKKLFTALAREEIIENGNWLSYCKENSPSFDI